jgi:hypothetical protein
LPFSNQSATFLNLFCTASLPAILIASMLSRRNFLVATILSTCSAAGCGTIIYPERRGQTRGVLDPGVVLLDGLGLLLFLVPGLIAFAVDFSTGAIFLPQGGESVLSTKGRQGFQTISLAPNQLSRPQIAEAVSEHTGRRIQLEEGRYHTAKLHDLDHFWPTTESLLAEHGSAAQS